MKILDALGLSTRMFKTRALRTFLTILGVSVGIGAVLFLVSFGYGLQRAILGQITTTDSLLSLDVVSGDTELIKLTQDDVDDIKSIENVDEVSPLISIACQFSIGELTGNGVAYAVDSSLFRLSGIKESYGRLFIDENKPEVVISSAGMQMFDLSSEEVIGQDVKLTLFISRETDEGYEEVDVYERSDNYKVVGVIDDENANYIYIPKNTIRNLNIDNFDQLKVKVNSDDNMGVVRNKIIKKGFLVSSLSDTIDEAEKIFRVIQIILALFGLVALSVSAIGMFNTMTIALLERINEIGIMGAIGITKRDIRRIFLLESVIMGFLGGVGGLLVGYMGGEIANFGVNLLAKTFGGEALDLFYYPTWFVLFIVVFSTIIGFLTGVYPSIKASKINPLSALRYK